MRILLIHTAFQHQEMMVSPPLGLLYLAGAARQDGHDVTIMDRRLPGISSGDVIQVMSDWHPDLIGFSSLTCEAADLKVLMNAARNCCPQAVRIAGGPHPSTSPEDLVMNSDIHAAVINEGEITFLEILQGCPFSSIRGLAIKSSGHIVKTPPRPFIEDLDRLAPPAWDLIDVPAYSESPRFGLIAGGSPYAVIMTSRGCPTGCVYCHSIHGRRWRLHSIDWIIREIETLTALHGVKEIQILDDNFCFDLNRVQALCDLLVKRFPGLLISFPGGIRADHLDDETLIKLKNAGTFRISYSIETASPRLQKVIHKNLDLDYSRRIIRLTAKLGIVTHGHFLIGLPAETLSEMLKTFRYAYTSGIHGGVFSRVIPYPGTELRQWMTDEGPAEQVCKTDSYEFLDSMYNLSSLSNRQVKILQHLFNLCLYLSPRRLAGLFMLMPEKRQFAALITRWLGRIKRFSSSHVIKSEYPLEKTTDSDRTTDISNRLHQTRDHYNRYPLEIEMTGGMLNYELNKNLIGRFLDAAFHLSSGLIVDAGCGCGRISRILRLNEQNVFGFDLSRTSLRIAHKSGIDVAQANCLQLPLPDGCARAIISYGVLHHTPDWQTGFVEFNRVTRPDADLFIAMNRRYSLNHFAYCFPGKLLRSLRKNGHERWIRFLFQLYTPCGVILKWLQTGSLSAYPHLWNQFNDVFLSPVNTFLSDREISDIAREMGWSIVEKSSSHFGGMWNFWFRKDKGKQ